MRSLRLLFAGLAVALATCGCGGGGAAAPVAPAADAGQVFNTSVKSASNGFTYPIQVYVPASYATGTATLPAIYATESDAPYGIATSGSGYSGAAQSRFDVFKQAMQSHGTQAILVGIGGTDRRGTDFLLPGAVNYLNFIAKELAPAIERQYRADPHRRALSGLSHGGYFVVAALVLEAPTGTLSFSHYLSTESSYGAHADVAAYLDFVKQLEAVNTPLPATLLLAGAPLFNGPIVEALYAELAAHPHPGFTVLKAQYNTTHVGADLPAFEEALMRFYP